ncbi:MAG: prepilin-type N-terminal cleavage/methylation domain-containing protein [Planctomycetes bacterium]|nr:prepilin-type N-terminal cleavage/methylation domain-containing protein [Planctomycetota bacterium]
MILRSNLPIVALHFYLTPGGSFHDDPENRGDRGDRGGRGERESRGYRGGRGFTLVEMLIVMGVMLVLSALTIMVIGSATRASEIRQTKNILRILEMAVGEWELVADRKISYGVLAEPDPNARYNIDQSIIETSGTGPNFHFSNSIFDLLGIIERTAQSRDILADIDPEFLTDGTDADGNVRLGLRDPWDTPIRAIFPGRLWVGPSPVWPGDDPLLHNEDGTVRTLIEQFHGVAVSRQILFVSAGPDGEWGNLFLNVAMEDLSEIQRDDPNSTNDLEAAADNIYSYEALRPRPAP